jgi:hypothetical protein
MMKQTVIEKLSGLQVLQNSLTVTPGFFERADNVTVVQDYIMTKRRGMRYSARFPSAQVINQLFNYGASVFATSQNKLYRLVQNVQTAQASVSNGSPTITITKANHGLTTGDFISDLNITNTDAIVAAFPKRTAAFYGIRQVTVTNANVYTVQASQNATATVTSGASAVSYYYYAAQTGQAVTITSSGVGTSRVAKANKNAYFTTDNGILKLEREDLPILKAGIPSGLDMQGTIGKSPSNISTGPFGANKQIAYKTVFGRRDANQNLVLGEPSEALVLRNIITDIASGSLSYNVGTHVLTITSTAHGLSNGDVIYLFNFVGTGATIEDGTPLPITFIDANTFSIDFDDIGITTITTVTSLSYGVSTTVYLTATIPSELDTTEYLYQIYRTTESVDVNTLPEENYRLVYEANLTSAFIAQGFLTFTDEVDQILVQSGSQLYTNPTAEGPLQENARPPFARDISLFRGYTFYANTIDYRTLDLAIVAPSLISNGDYVTFGTQNYIYRGNANNEPLGNESTTSPASTSSYVEVTQTNHGFILNDTIRLTAISGITGVSPGTFVISAVPSANTFRFATGASGSGTVTYEGLADSSGKRLVKRYIANGDTTLSESIALTARGTVKAFNRNANSTVYAKYVSPPNGAPGKMYFEAKNLSAVTFAVTVSNAGASSAFIPTVPTSGIAVSDTQTIRPNELRISKYNESEAVPRTNSILVGSESAAILREVPLRDSLIISKQDGVFRLNGDTTNNFSVSALDTTVILKSTNSFAVLNNSAYGLTNQGVVQITDNSVRIASREIEPLLSAVIGNPNIEDASCGISYESERTYMLSTLTPGRTGSVPDVCYVYNYLTNAWTTYSGEKALFHAGIVSSLDDKLMSVQSDSTFYINKERKDQTKVDFSEQEACVPILGSVIATASVLLGANKVSVTDTVAHGFEVGQLLTISNVPATFSAAFTGGDADISGLRVVTDIDSEYSFRYQASSASNLAAMGSVNFQVGISEQDVSVSVTTGDINATFTTSVPHNLVTGNPISVHTVSAAIAAALGATTDLTGYRTVSVVSPTSFSVKIAAVATGTASGTANISDRKQTKLRVTAITDSNYQPQVGDAIVCNNSIFLINAVERFSTTAYVLTLRFKYKRLSTDQAFINSAYKSSLRFSPLTFGNSSQLKQIGEFQATFRNNSSCTKLYVNFTTDAFVSCDGNDWDFAVGTTKAPIQFGGWGSLPWGRFPWGGGSSIQREFTTRPAVLLRMYVPKQAFIATFLQPVLEHKVAGEPFELQSIAVFQQTVTQRVSK